MISRKAALACALLLLLPAVAVWDLNGDSFDLTDRQLVLVVTDSMDGDNHEYDIGSFPANTLVMVEHLNNQEKRFLRVGDVISYYDDDILQHHRVIQVNSGSVYVHGDNNHSTEIVPYDSINGKVVGTNWIVGHAIVFIEQNFLLFLGSMFLICAALVVYSMYSGTSKKEGVD